jgi:hypothetical protein
MAENKAQENILGERASDNIVGFNAEDRTKQELNGTDITEQVIKRIQDGQADQKDILSIIALLKGNGIQVDSSTEELVNRKFQQELAKQAEELVEKQRLEEEARRKAAEEAMAAIKAAGALMLGVGAMFSLEEHDQTQQRAPQGLEAIANMFTLGGQSRGTLLG